MRSPTPNETDDQSHVAQEALVRATLTERAGFDVEGERDWPLVSSRLRFESASMGASGATFSHSVKAPAGWMRGALHRVRPRTWPGAIMLAATCVALMGVGFATFEWAGPFAGQKLGIIGEQRLYTTINQSRDDAGVTITVDKAYADAGNMYIAFRIQPDQAAAGTFSLATFSLTDQYGGDPGGVNIQCAARTDPTVPQVCVLDSPPSHPPTGATTLTIALAIQAIYRIPTTGDSQRIEGSWLFVFTVPFHTKNLGSGGPYAQPVSR